MAGKVMTLETAGFVLDRLGCEIARKYQELQVLRQPKVTEWEEVRKYIFATSTKTTTNAKLPWKNTTTIPKACQIRDNLLANYMAGLFPATKKQWFTWLADRFDPMGKEKAEAIIAYMTYAVTQPWFKQEIQKCVADYVDYGNTFGMPTWVDQTQVLEDGRTKVGFVGPSVQRVSPLDLVMNPTAPNFVSSPKVIRTMTSLGEIKGIIDSETTDENREANEKLWNYLKDMRTSVQSWAGDLKVQDTYFNVDGFTSFRSYMLSDYVELLTFYGDIFDWDTGEFLKNQKIMVVDKHKVISKGPNPSIFGYAPIYHVGWRPRQDNLYAMGPLDNLIGMQYRIDHVENLKADVYDLLAYPVVKVKGYVEDFDWGPLERIHMDADGDVDMVQPPFQMLQGDNEVAWYMAQMEEMAGSPKEAMGFRTPGEKTAYEVQRLENAAARIFQSKIVQFEELFLEPLLNGMLELARRNMSGSTVVSGFDEYQMQTFMTITPEDIAGVGRLKPMAARHFAMKAEMIQNLTNFANSPLGQDPAIINHISGLKMAGLFEDLLDLKDYELVLKDVRVAEMADSQRAAQVAQEKMATEAQTPAGLQPDDHDPEVGDVPEIPMTMESQ